MRKRPTIVPSLDKGERQRQLEEENRILRLEEENRILKASERAAEMPRFQYSRLTGGFGR